MREVKFRGRRINDGEWVYGFPHTIDTVGEGYTGRAIQTHFLSGRPISYQIDKVTLSEYTGLKDKNGMEIYEGGIVKTLSGDVGEVIFSEGKFVRRISKVWAQDITSTVEIIGNIHEHPELLGDSN